MHSGMQCSSLMLGKCHVDSIIKLMPKRVVCSFLDSTDQLLLLPADTAKEADAQPEDVAITLNGTQDASKLGRHTALGESSSSSSSSSSDGQADGLYAGKLLPSKSCGSNVFPCWPTPK